MQIMYQTITSAHLFVVRLQLLHTIDGIQTRMTAIAARCVLTQVSPFVLHDNYIELSFQIF